MRGDDALLGQHGGMGLAGGDVLAIKVPVEVDRGIDLLHDRVGTFAEAAAPHLVAHDRLLLMISLLLLMIRHSRARDGCGSVDAVGTGSDRKRIKRTVTAQP